MDFYYQQGYLLNFYSHSLSFGLGRAGNQAKEYVLYGMNTNRFPRLWAANAIKLYEWWLQRSNVQVNVTHSKTGLVSVVSLTVANATSSNTTVEVLTPATSLFCSLNVYTNGVIAGPSVYRTTQQVVKVRVGNTVTNVLLTYYPYAPSATNYSENFDALASPALPGSWSAGGSGIYNNWVTQTTEKETPPNAAFVAGAAGTGSATLTSPVYPLPGGPIQLSFRHKYDLEANVGGVALDGGVLEIKIGTNDFVNITTAGGTLLEGGYTHLVSSSFGNPLAGQLAWSGSSGGFVTTTAMLPASASGQNVQFRWRLGSDSGNASIGWYVDNVAVLGRTCLCCTGGTNSPVLPSQTNRTVFETVPLAITNTAADADFPNDAIFYQLTVSPAGASIDSDGIISWTPSEAQGPGTNTLTTVATDSTGRTATNSFVVTVLDSNSPPVLPAQSPITINELSTLVVTNTASDEDLPIESLSYSLLTAPAAAAISASGVISWNPGELDGPSTNMFTVRVVDDGSPPLAATNSFSVIVNEVNSAPVLPNQPPRMLNELETLVITNTASDADLPVNILSYQLVNPPLGVTISATGVITWTPSDTQGPSTNQLVTVVSDNGVPNLRATNVAVVVVNDSITCDWTNLIQQNFDAGAPTALPADWVTESDGVQGPWTIQSGVSDTPTNAAFAANPAQIGNSFLVSPTVTLPEGQTTLFFRHSFGFEAVTQAAYDGGVLEIKIGTNSFVDITNAGGVFLAGGYNRVISANFNSPIAGRGAWSGNSGGFITTLVSLPPLAANQTMQLRWRCATDDGNGSAVVGWYVDSIILSNRTCQVAINTAPGLPSQTNRVIFEQTVLNVDNAAIDAEQSSTTLTYQLDNPPAGATIDSTGLITWIPSEEQGPSTNAVVTIVTDSGGLSATNSFQVAVLESNSAPVLNPISNYLVHAGDAVTFATSAADPDLPAQQLTYYLTNNPPAGISLNPDNGQFLWMTAASDVNSTNLITVAVSDDGPPALTDLQSFTVTIIDRPLIESIGVTNGIVAVTWTAINGRAYQLQQSESLNPADWQDVGVPIVGDGGIGFQTNAVPAATECFYRIRLSP